MVFLDLQGVYYFNFVSPSLQAGYLPLEHQLPPHKSSPMFNTKGTLRREAKYYTTH